MIVNKYTKGGGSGSGVTPEQVQEQINSALTPYWDSANTEDAISAATAGKADAANVTARNSDIPPDGPLYLPKWNEEGIITGDGTDLYRQAFYVNGRASAKIYKHQSSLIPPIYAPVSAGTAGDILVSSGPGNAPVWSAVTFPETKILVDFDKTPQSERAALYADLKALYDGGSGSSINKLYDFYKTVNTWQGQKIDYYTFSGNTLVFGQVVSPENVTDQVVYVQVMEIDSAGNVNVVTNAIGASGGGVTQEYVDSAVTILQDQLNEIDEVIPAAIVDLNERVDEISAATPSIDLSGYYTSAQTEDAISAATADFINSGDVKTVIGNYSYLTPDYDQGVLRFFRLYQKGSSTATTIGNPSINGEKMMDNTMGKNFVLPTSADVQAQIDSTLTYYWESGITKEYVDSAITQVQDQLDIIDEVIPAAIVDINNRMVSSSSVSTLWRGTQTEYNSIITKDPNTLYIIVNE